MIEQKIFFTVFISVFIAELGDKTQLATMLYSADKEISKLTVFFAASAALIVASAIGVWFGSTFANYINPKTLNIVAGMGFIVIGLFTLIKS